MIKLLVNTDGGSRGNPGPAAIGVVFWDENEKVLFEYKKCIGVATNNEAEYQAIIEALKILQSSRWLKENQDNDAAVFFRLDSQLVVEQISGNYRIKKSHIQDKVDQIDAIISTIGIKISFQHIPREKNKEADKLVNLALDHQVEKKDTVL